MVLRRVRAADRGQMLPAASRSYMCAKMTMIEKREREHVACLEASSMRRGP